MALFMLLIVPLPFTIRRKMFTFMYTPPSSPYKTPHSQTYRSESPLVAKLQYGMKITFIFILILFIDSVNRVYRVQVELAESKEGGYVSPTPIIQIKLTAQQRSISPWPRTYGSPGSQILLPTQYVPLRFHAFPFSDP
jgi:hypothetical protein